LRLNIEACGENAQILVNNQLGVFMNLLSNS